MNSKGNNASQESMDNWKQFQGTELGPLLAQIYGNSRPKIDYPTVKTRKFQPQDKFVPYASTSSSHRNAEKTQAKINVPKPNQKLHSDVSLIDCIPKRRNENLISKEIDEIKMRQQHYRPTFSKPISSNEEKERLSQIFEYKGGRTNILPKEFSNKVTDTPLEIASKLKEQQRIDEIKFRRGILSSKKPSTRSTMSADELLAEQISEEIKDRQKHMTELMSNGTLTKDIENRLIMEINQRIKDLKLLEQ